jgi:superfamily II DNA or RNA helicase
LRLSTCLKTGSAKQAEAQGWEKVSQFIASPDYLLAQAKAKVLQLQNDDEQMKRDELQLEEEIKKLNAERQEFIPKARKGHISEEESTPQISVMYDKELGVKRRLTAIEQEEDAFEKLDLEEQVRKDVAELQSEMAELMTANPKTLDECHRVFLLKKRIVDTVLMEASIDERREIHIKFCTDFSTHSGQTQERVDIFDARRKL